MPNINITGHKSADTIRFLTPQKFGFGWHQGKLYFMVLPAGSDKDVCIEIKSEQTIKGIRHVCNIMDQELLTLGLERHAPGASPRPDSPSVSAPTPTTSSSTPPPSSGDSPASTSGT